MNEYNQRVFTESEMRAVRKRTIKEIKDRLFKDFKDPKGNEYFNNGWKQCRNQVLELIKYL